MSIMFKHYTTITRHLATSAVASFERALKTDLMGMLLVYRQLYFHTNRCRKLGVYETDSKNLPPEGDPRKSL
jgi:hypothetical protein